MNREFLDVPIEAIIVKGSVRENYGDMVTLENSIRKLGVLDPLIIDANQVLICGERRLQACRNLGLATVPALKLDIAYDSMTALDIQSDLNLCREPFSNKDLNCLIDRKKASIPARDPDEGHPGLIEKLRKTFSSSKTE